MATRAQRWRGPRRSDVQELRAHQQQTQTAGSQTARLPRTQIAPLQQSGSYSQDDAFSTSGAASSSHASASSSAGLHASAAVPHFKYGFLSAGAQSSVGPQALRVNRRPGIMDATRSFEPEGTAGLAAEPESEAAKQARVYEQSQTQGFASGLGYGSRHQHHFAYLSRDQPPRATESFFLERPCVFPTVELPPLNLRPTNDLAHLPFHEQEAYSRPFKSQIASGLGFGPRRTTYHAYVANTYWRTR